MDFRTRFLAYYRYLKTTDRKWYRHSIAVLLIIGGLIGFLPVLGFWMLPLGLSLLAVDFPIVRRFVRRTYVALGRTIVRVRKFARK
ncbi:hypothetical protein K1I42_10415 [Hydrogenophilus thermoluteolus]|nr:hypothetical protein [Hydrogenophilus thermoluteolus]MBW7657697.1 hypothetical protein [Hydrogenophilus thermoluteolus]